MEGGEAAAARTDACGLTGGETPLTARYESQCGGGSTAIPLPCTQTMKPVVVPFASKPCDLSNCMES